MEREIHGWTCLGMVLEKLEKNVQSLAKHRFVVCQVLVRNYSVAHS